MTTVTTVNGIGTVEIYGISPEHETRKKLLLFNVKYSPHFHTNLVSYGLMFKKTGFRRMESRCMLFTRSRIYPG